MGQAASPQAARRQVDSAGLLLHTAPTAYCGSAELSVDATTPQRQELFLLRGPSNSLRIESVEGRASILPNSAFTLEQRVAFYASDAIQDPQNLKAMKVLLETHLGRSWEPRHKADQPVRRGAVIQNNTKEATLAAAATCRGEISPDSVLRKMERSGHVFAATNRKKSVSAALQKLRKEGKLIEARKGRAGKHNLYRLPQ